MNKKLLMILFATFLLAGCINIDIEQELHRDGTSNYAFQVEMDIPPMMQGEMDETPANDFEQIEANLRETYGDAYGESVRATQLDNGFRVEIDGIDLTEEQVEISEELPTADGQVHVLEEETSFLTRTYRYEIPFDNVGDDLVDDEVSLDGVNEDTPVFTQEVDQELPEQGMEDMFDEEALMEMFDMTYTITVFADVDDTNGEIVDSRTVTFDLMQMEENGYVEFSENRISSWFSTIFS